MRISVVIPCYNEKNTLNTLLRMVCNAPYPAGVTGVEIVVVDDFSKDGTRDILRAIEKNPQGEIGLKANQKFHVGESAA